MTIATAAAALAPALMPMMSGLASGLRSIVWKVTPPEPEAEPDEHGQHGARQPQPADGEGGAGHVSPSITSQDVGGG